MSRQSRRNGQRIPRAEDEKLKEGTIGRRHYYWRLEGDRSLERLPIWRGRANVCVCERVWVSRRMIINQTGKGKHKKRKSKEGREKSESKREKKKSRKRDWKGKERGRERGSRGNEGNLFALDARSGWITVIYQLGGWPWPKSEWPVVRRLRYGINHWCMDGPGGKAWRRSLLLGGTRAAGLYLVR